MTDATTSSQSLPSRPTLPFTQAFAAQLRLLAAGKKRGFAIGFGLALAQVVVLAAWGYIFSLAIEIGEGGASYAVTHVSELQEELDFPLDEGKSALAGTFVGMLVFALFWPFRVWRGEAPSRRDYHWAMPVSHRDHDLARVAAGAVGLLAVAAVLYAAGAVTALAAGHAGLLELSAWAWVGLLLGPLLPYALSSIFLVRCEHPAGWLWGVLVLLLALWLLDAGREVAGVSTLVSGRFGLGWAAGGAVFGEWMARPAGGLWLATWAAWLALFTGGVLLAASTRSR